MEIQAAKAIERGEKAKATLPWLIFHLLSLYALLPVTFSTS
jgi:hypothetical protein